MMNLPGRVATSWSGDPQGRGLAPIGCLLGDRLGLRLQVTNSGRLTFEAGEDALSRWMAENAFVTWLEHDQPWTMEDELIATGIFPLNLAGNSLHPFHTTLTAIRRQMKEDAI
jgi:hypothetical protein